MKKSNSIVLFNQRQVRRHWDEEKELWFFSIVDVIEILTESINPRKYWSVLKTRLKQEGSEMATNCSQLKLLASDGKKYLRLVRKPNGPFKFGSQRRLWRLKIKANGSGNRKTNRRKHCNMKKKKKKTGESIATSKNAKQLQSKKR